MDLNADFDFIENIDSKGIEMVELLKQSGQQMAEFLTLLSEQATAKNNQEALLAINSSRLSHQEFLISCINSVFHLYEMRNKILQ